MRLCVGLIGCGSIGTVIAEAIDGVELAMLNWLLCMM